MRSRDVVPVGLCRRLEKAIGAKWAGRFEVALTPVYTIGDLLAYCKSRKWVPKMVQYVNSWPYGGATVVLSITPGLRTRAKNLPSALARAVLAAVEEGGK